MWLYSLRDLLPEIQQRTFNYFFGVLSHLFARELTTSQLDIHELHLHQSLALMERDFLANITTHICHHFCKYMKRFGPVYSSWMFSFERMNSWISRRCNNKAHMERCVMETYQVSIVSVCVYICY